MLLQIEQLHEREQRVLDQEPRAQPQVRKIGRLSVHSRRTEAQADVSDSSDVDFDESELKAARRLSKDQRRKLVRKAMSEVYRMQIRDPSSLVGVSNPTRGISSTANPGRISNDAGNPMPGAVPARTASQRFQGENAKEPKLDAGTCLKHGEELLQRGNVSPCCLR